jgi:hypothetical protein
LVVSSATSALASAGSSAVTEPLTVLSSTAPPARQPSRRARTLPFTVRPLTRPPAVPSVMLPLVVRATTSEVTSAMVTAAVHGAGVDAHAGGDRDQVVDAHAGALENMRSSQPPRRRDVPS